LRPGVQADHLNDDCLGRTLDAIFAFGITRLFAIIARRALPMFKVDTSIGHLDTTSFSFHGDFDPQGVDEAAVRITWGYSKDKRTDLKQAVFALITAHRTDIPMWIEAIDGNHTDVSSMPTVIEGFCEQLDGPAPLMVMDAAFYSEENISTHTDVRWLCRVPDTIGQVGTLYEEADSSTWQVVDDNYRYQAHSSTYGGVEQRWVLVHSQARQERQMRTLQRRLDKAREEATTELSSLGRKTFSCQSDAEAAAAQLSKSWRYHSAVPEYVSRAHYDKPGRPAAGATPSRLSWRVRGEVAEDADAIAKSQRKAGMYVIGTNEPSEGMTSAELLSLYRRQGSTVERGFRFLKDPMFFAHGMYLQKPERVMALLMVMTLGLLVYSLAERSLRAALVEKNETVPDQKGKPTQRITIRRVFQIFEGIDLLTIDNAGTRLQQILNFSELHGRIVNLLPEEVKTIYALPGGCGR